MWREVHNRTAARYTRSKPNLRGWRAVVLFRVNLIKAEVSKTAMMRAFLPASAFGPARALMGFMGTKGGRRGGGYEGGRDSSHTFALPSGPPGASAEGSAHMDSALTEPLNVRQLDVLHCAIAENIGVLAQALATLRPAAVRAARRRS